MLQIVEHDHFLIPARGSELPARGSITDRNRERQLRRAEPGPGHADTAGDQRPQHREEATRVVGDWTAIAPIRCHAPKAIQERLARHAHLVEPEAAVVNPIQSALVAAVLDPHVATRPPAFVADRHQQNVHPTPLAARDQLSEDRGQAAVARHVADVILARVIVGRVDHELLALRVVGCGGPDRLDVGSVASLGHGEASRQLHRHRLPQVALVMSLRAQPPDDATEEPVLHADLDQQGEVDERDGFEGGHRPSNVPFPAVLAWEEQPRAARLTDHAGLLHHPGAVLLDRQAMNRPQKWRCVDLSPDLLPDLGPAAVEHAPQFRDFYGHLYDLLHH